jgi:Arc/MetJ-type ribon-helix-helix transcriptional regulator
MKTSTIPAIRVEPALRGELERSLREGETLSEFVEQAVRAALQRRLDQGEFIARGIASLDRAREANGYIDADTVIGRLQHKLDSARTRQAKNGV